MRPALLCQVKKTPPPYPDTQPLLRPAACALLSAAGYTLLACNQCPEDSVAGCSERVPPTAALTGVVKVPVETVPAGPDAVLGDAPTNAGVVVFAAAAGPAVGIVGASAAAAPVPTGTSGSVVGVMDTPEKPAVGRQDQQERLSMKFNC